jgi:hypothetical protein
MKNQKLLYFVLAATLLASCTSDDSKDILPGGTPVEVSLSFAVANAECPQVSVSSGNASVATASEKAVATEAMSTATAASIATAAASGTTSSGTKASASTVASAASSPLQVSYTAPATSTQLRSGTSLTNVWVLQFDSTLTTGATSTAGACVAAKYIGTVTTGDNLNPTLLTGTGQVIYVIANGPSAGSITTSTYTLATFKTATAYFSGSITSDAPYIGRIYDASIEANGEVYAAASTPVITLYRIAAKISLNLNFAVTGYTLTSVQLFNAPTYMYYEYGSGFTAFPATPSSSNITTTGMAANIIPSTAASGTYTWYTGENKRGTSSTATTAYLKDFLHTPTDNSSQYYCTYIRVQAKKNDSTTVMNYYLYVGADGTTDFNVTRNWDYTLNATIGGNEAAQQAFMGIDGRIRMTTSNCYIVAPGSSITIPVNVKGNANCPLPADASSTILAGTGLSTTHTATTVSVLWQTASGLITVGTFNSTTQTVTLTASSSTGNGVVVAKDASSNVLWSWHIWVTDYNPNTKLNGTTYSYTPTTSITNVFMDRDLGALTTTYVNDANILHYQWGRKDPFPVTSVVDASGTSTSVDVTTTTQQTMLWSSQNPLRFICYEGDWCSTLSNYLWMSTGGTTTTTEVKTIFDPCPAGWRVPAWRSGVSPWNGLDSYETTATYYGVSGYNWTTTPGIGFWPATGYREPKDGTPSLVGGNGDYWSATPASGNVASGLVFGPGVVYPGSGSTRATGFAVRCVQEW